MIDLTPSQNFTRPITTEEWAICNEFKRACDAVDRFTRAIISGKMAYKSEQELYNAQA